MRLSRIRPTRFTPLLAAALFVLQVVGGGAVTLAHARDAVTAPAAFESQHDAGCPVLHDALRCALCHYASARVVVQRAVVTLPDRPTRVHVPATRLIGAASSTTHRTAPARAPPALLS